MGAPDMIVNGTAAGGPPIGGTGTPNTIPRWTGPSTLGDSRATDDGTTFVVGSGAYAGTALPGGMQLKTATPIYVATDGTRTTIVGTDGTTSCFVGSLTNHNFQIRASNATAITVKPTGEVGIGTASPVTTLANTASAIDDGANGVATTGLTWSPNAVGFAAGFWNKYGAVGNGLFVRTSDTSSSTRVFHVCAGAGAVPNSLLFVRGDGNVGIGTASPGNSKLNITDASAFAFQAVNIVASGTNQDAGLRLQGSGGKAFRIQQPNTSAGIFFYDETNSAERARIDSAGNFGIGTTPNAWNSAIRALDLRTNSLWNFNSGSDSVAYWTVNAYTDAAGNVVYKNSAAASQYTQISGAHVWARAASGVAGAGCSFLESARIDSAGRWLVGTSATPSSPEVKAVIAGTGNGGQQWVANAGGGLAIVPQSSGSGFFYTFPGLTGAEGYLASFKATSTGIDVSVANATPGIKLPATPGNTDPNTLDAYEDGGTAGTGGKTWTPTDTSGAGLTLTVTKAQYIRIGKQITFAFELTYPVTADATNAAISVPVTGITNWAGSGVCYVNSLGLRMWMISGGNLYFYTTTGVRMTNAQLSGLAVYGGSSYIAA